MAKLQPVGMSGEELEDAFVDWYFGDGYDIHTDLESKGYGHQYLGLDIDQHDLGDIGPYALVVDEFPFGDLLYVKKVGPVFKIQRELGLTPILRHTVRAAKTAWVLAQFDDDEVIELIDTHEIKGAILHGSRTHWHQAAVVHPCARPSCKWQGSVFDEFGPVTHVEAETKEDAVKELFEYNSHWEPHPGAVDEVFTQMDEFRYPLHRNPADVRIGFSWESPEGTREVIGQTEGGLWVVKTGEKRGAQLLSTSDLEFDVKKDAANLAFRSKEAGVLAEAARSKAARDDTKGFYDDMAPAQAGKARAALHRSQGLSGKFARRKEGIERLVKEGWRVEGDEFVGPSGSFYTKRDMTKTGLDYAKHLEGLEYGLEENPPFSGWREDWWLEESPRDETKIAYRRKRDALNVFMDWNQVLIDLAFNGPSQEHPPDSFDNFNHKYDLKGKRKINTFAKAVWFALPAGTPYHLEDIDVNMLNETSPMRHNADEGQLTIPDYAEERRLVDLEAAYWQEKYGDIFPEEEDEEEAPF